MANYSSTSDHNALLLELLACLVSSLGRLYRLLVHFLSDITERRALVQDLETIFLILK